MSGLVSPLLWQSVPFKEPDAWLDFLGQHAWWHRELAKATKQSYTNLDDLRNNLEPHAHMHEEVAAALGINPNTDLSSYDLTTEQAFIGWMWVHSLDHERFRTATGL